MVGHDWCPEGRQCAARVRHRGLFSRPRAHGSGRIRGASGSHRQGRGLGRGGSHRIAHERQSARRLPDALVSNIRGLSDALRSAGAVAPLSRAVDHECCQCRRQVGQGKSGADQGANRRRRGNRRHSRGGGGLQPDLRRRGVRGRQGRGNRADAHKRVRQGRVCGVDGLQGRHAAQRRDACKPHRTHCRGHRGGGRGGHLALQELGHSEGEGVRAVGGDQGCVRQDLELPRQWIRRHQKLCFLGVLKSCEHGSVVAPADHKRHRRRG